MLTHPRFGMLHIPKTAGSLIKEAISNAVGPDVEYHGPSHTLVEFTGPVLCLTRHPAAWLRSFMAHQLRSGYSAKDATKTIWSGLPQAMELCELVESARHVCDFIKRAGEAKLVSKCWQWYLDRVDNPIIGRCEEWPIHVKRLLDESGVTYSMDELYIQGPVRGRSASAVSLPQVASDDLRVADPDAFAIGGY